ncbi:glycine zipper domain-containing protein [Paraburkholderia sp. B3]|uniref:glycine zipper domain-containing protein n=1 Tax=Paraburkholderia sp. B3 TaxID=3134791 RepID=UPI003982B649
MASSHSTAQSGAAAPVLGTAGGAAAGALIGAGAGNAGAGAAIGAGVGLLLGSAAGANQRGQTEAALQRQYDNAYAQCITAKGDTIVMPPAPVVVAPPVVYTRPVYYYYAPY